MIYSRREWLKAEWEHLLWKVGWKDYCMQCDEIFSRPQKRRHRDCRCAGLWQI